MKTLSIITINRNNVDGLKKTMDSVMSQNCTDYEYIIIDGASTDGSKELIQQYAENPLFKDLITYWISEPDTGIYNAMNKGIGIATGEYCLFLNSGDWFVDNTRVKKISEAAYQEDIIYFDAIFVFTDKNFLRKLPDKINADFLYKYHTINHQNVLIKTTLQKSAPYLESYKYASDADFFIKMFLIEKRTSRHILDVLTYYEAVTGLSSRAETKLINFSEWIDICLKYFPDKLYTDYQLFNDYHFGYCGLLHILRNLFCILRKTIFTLVGKKNT